MQVSRLAMVSTLLLAAGCAAGITPATAPQTSPAQLGPMTAPAAGYRARAVAGTHRIDPVQAARFRALRRGSGPAPRASSIHGFWAIWPSVVNTGGYAEQTIWPNLKITSSATNLYAPTFYPSENSCIEITTAYLSTGLEIWAWDWCNTGGYEPGTAVTVNSSFLSQYARASGSSYMYGVMLEQTNASKNTWTAYLYDFATSSWSSFYTSSGTAQTGSSYGWDAFEAYSPVSGGVSSVCGNLATIGAIESSNFQLRSTSGTWALVSPSESFVANDGPFDCSKLDFTVPQANYQYSVSYQ